MLNQAVTGETVESVHLLRMEPDEQYGLAAECNYDDIYWRSAQRRGTKYEEDLQEKQIAYSGMKLAAWALDSKLGLGNLRVLDTTYATTHILCALTSTTMLGELKGYLEQYRLENNVQFLRHPGFEYPGVVAWLIPAKEPALIFKPTTMKTSEIQSCVNYKRCELFIENHAAWLQSGEVSRDMKHPVY